MALAHSLTQQTLFLVTLSIRVRVCAPHGKFRQTASDASDRCRNIDAIHPLAGVVVGQHHVQAELLAQHPGDGPAHRLLFMPTSA